MVDDSLERTNQIKILTNIYELICQKEQGNNICVESKVSTSPSREYAVENQPSHETFQDRVDGIFDENESEDRLSMIKDKGFLF